MIIVIGNDIDCTKVKSLILYQLFITKMTGILDNKSFSYAISSHAVKPHCLQLSTVQKRELFDFIKNTKNKEEYRRAIAVKQKLEGQSFRTIAKNLGVNYRNVYHMIKSYKEYGLDGIRSKRK